MRRRALTSVYPVYCRSDLVRSFACLKNDSANANRLSKTHGCIRFRNFRARADEREMRLGAWLFWPLSRRAVTCQSAVCERARCRKRAQRTSGPSALDAGAANLGRFSSSLWASGALDRKPRIYAAQRMFVPMVRPSSLPIDQIVTQSAPIHFFAKHRDGRPYSSFPQVTCHSKCNRAQAVMTMVLR